MTDILRCAGPAWRPSAEWQLQTCRPSVITDGPYDSCFDALYLSSHYCCFLQSGQLENEQRETGRFGSFSSLRGCRTMRSHLGRAFVAAAIVVTSRVCQRSGCFVKQCRYGRREIASPFKRHCMLFYILLVRGHLPWVRCQRVSATLMTCTIFDLHGSLLLYGHCTRWPHSLWCYGHRWGFEMVFVGHFNPFWL